MIEFIAGVLVGIVGTLAAEYALARLVLLFRS